MHCETSSIERAVETAGNPGEAARKRLLSIRGEPLFLADWSRAVFIHYEIPAEKLQRDVPFELDLYEGKAYVSLVAFTMHRMRPFYGGKLGAWLFKPIARNDFLNVRTYVRHQRESGIYFMTEWMNNPLSVRLGPMTFGLPYRFGELNYQHRHEKGNFDGSVRELTSSNSFCYKVKTINPEFAPCPAGSIDEFLLERYTAFTSHGAKRRFFRIWHAPWAQQTVEVSVAENGLLCNTWPWFADATLAGGNYSPGARGVWMGRPHLVQKSRPFAYGTTAR